MLLLLVPIISGLLSISVAIYLFLNLKKANPRYANMAEIAGYIALGVRIYLSRQFRTILLITPFLAIAIYVALGPWVALTFALGVLTSLSTGFLGMNAAVRANLKTAEDATDSPVRAFHSAVFGGSVMGFSIIGFSIVMLAVLYFIFKAPEPLVGFGFGASLAALFAQIGGGIFTKSADIGADLVGKVEKNIPEDDPRNAAVIADLVGDNVGDCAGRGSDLFESFSDDIITGTIVAVAALSLGRYGPLVVFFPLLLQSVGLLSSIVGVFSIKWFKSSKPEMAFNLGMMTTTGLATLGSFLLAKYLVNDLSLFLGTFLGIVVMLVVAFFTRYYAGMGGKPVKNIAEASKRGAALNLITGLAYGLQSPLISIVMIVAAVSVAFVVSRGSLLAIVAVNIGTDLLIGYIMTADAFGPITDNAAGIAAMSGAGGKVVRSLSSLDAVGNTMKATTKAYAMSSGTVTSFVLFTTFFGIVGLRTLDISKPFAVAFLFLGIALPYLIASLVIGSTAKTALQMVDEVRRQFQTLKGLMEGTDKPDYAACVDIATKNALREMLLPGLISITVPMVVGFTFGAWALGSLLIGAVAAAALLGPFFNNAGTAFDNAKKIIEEVGHKGSFEHQAAVVADTVGDSLKDVAGPALIIFMKLIGMAALLMASVIH
ncbi:MAG: sodium-translocating pyrophosphatase [Chloroflexi bacterium]|nr:sodium-translocating pyrophosphatase [Chloroflexota bacterium]